MEATKLTYDHCCIEKKMKENHCGFCINIVAKVSLKLKVPYNDTAVGRFATFGEQFPEHLLK